MVLAELHGLTGHFPTIMRLKPSGATYEVAEIINLQKIRDKRRELRYRVEGKYYNLLRVYHVIECSRSL